MPPQLRARSLVRLKRRGVTKTFTLSLRCNTASSTRSTKSSSTSPILFRSRPGDEHFLVSFQVRNETVFDMLLQDWRQEWNHRGSRCSTRYPIRTLPRTHTRQSETVNTCLVLIRHTHTVRSTIYHCSDKGWQMHFTRTICHAHLGLPRYTATYKDCKLQAAWFHW